MRPLELLLASVELLAFLSLTIPPLRPVRWLQASVLAALLAAGGQALAEGPRWQMVPAYVLAGLLFLIWLLRGNLPAGRLAAATGIGLGALGLAVAVALPVLVPVFRLPRPTGRYEIGTLTRHWVDAARRELFTDDPDDRRELMVQIWYPAEGGSSSPRAAYVPDTGALTSLARMLHLPGFVFRHFRYVRTHAFPAAPPAAAEPAYPVLLFSSGRGGFRQESTHLFEALVSHGYVVVAIDSPYASSGVAFPDGRLVALSPRLYPQAHTGIPADRRFFDEVAIPMLGQDVSFALDQLAALNRADPDGLLTGRLDLERVGMIGPSLGGLAGAMACLRDPRFQAFLAMDVHMPAEVVRNGLKVPTMFISRPAVWMQREGWHPGNTEETQRTMREVYESLPGDGYLVWVPGMYHPNFSDAPLFSPLFSWLGITGPIDAQRSLAILDACTLAFFDKHLKGRSEVRIDRALEGYPEVIIETRRP